MDISSLNLSNADKERTLSELSDKTSKTTHRSLGQCLPKDIRDKMWPVTSDSDSLNTSNTDTSDVKKISIQPKQSPVASVSSDRWAATMKHNLNVLKRKPLDPDRLSNFRETVRVGLGNMVLEEPLVKKVKIDKIVWDPKEETMPKEKEDLCDVLSRRIKRIRVMSDQSSEDQSPIKRRLGWRDNTTTNQSSEHSFSLKWSNYQFCLSYLPNHHETYAQAVLLCVS